MRYICALFTALVFMTATVRLVAAAPTRSLDIRATRVAYFGNRFIVKAEGNVHIRLSDGTQLHGNYFSMDLKLNRYLLAGDVTIDGSDIHERAAAFAGYLDLDRSYLLTADGEPDRWTYFGLDFAHPYKGRQQPGDAFFIPDLTADKAFVYATGAIITPKTNVKFTNSRVFVVKTYIPTVNYVVNFAQNPNFSQNAFSGAVGDLPIFVNGSGHALTGLHLRFDGKNKGYLSFDQHFVWDRDYIVLSINPVTQEERQTNLIGFKSISPNAQARIFTQLSTAQHLFYQPEVASSYGNVSTIAAMKPFTFTLNADQYNTSLLEYPPGADEKNYEHPADFAVSVRSFDGTIWYRRHPSPLHYQFRAGYGYAHDGYHCGVNAACSDDPALDQGYILDYFGSARTPVPTITNHYLGGTFSLTGLQIGDRQKFQHTYINATFDRQREWFSLPHHVDTETGTATLSQTYGTKLAVFGGYVFSHTGDDYGPRQAEFYPEFGPIVTSTGTYVTYNAFRGFATSRGLIASSAYTPTQYFAFNLAVRRYFDFPAPIPGSFGQPPWQVATEVRLRLAPQVLIDISRTEYFHFGGAQPSFNVQFSR